MNKRLFISIIIFIFGMLLVGCNGNNKKVNSWDIDLVDKQAIISSEAMDVFNSVNDNKYQVVALLGKQVVAGTNYMFLCKDDNSYKVMVVYNNLENKASITSISDFDVTKYTNENISNNYGNLSGGWYVDVPSKGVMLDEKIQTAFDEATSKITGATYLPIGVLAHQMVSGTNYAVLCYGKLATQEENNGIYLLTLYEDLHNTREIVSIAYVDLATFNR